MTALVDAESVYESPAEPGAPVDPPDRPTTFASVIPRQHDRRPILPAALRNPEQRRTLARWSVGYAAHATGYHLTRSPKYATKVVFWAPVGLVNLVRIVVRWGFDLEAAGTRQNAATMNNTAEYLALSRHRDKRVRWRGWVLTLASLAVLAAVVAVTVAPPWVRWLTLAAALPPLAVLGRPADRPITDRVHTGPEYRKLTAELVRRALASLGIAGINQALAKDPGAITFPREIHRDGPGYLATVDLPFGVTATDVVDRRERLASGLRLPLDQVWPEPAEGHTGRLNLWVGDQPASQMRQPVWPLLRDGKVDVFRPFPFATDPRLDTVKAEMMFRNWLIGGVPGSGKTFAMRLLVLAAALDPRVELRGYELKGTGDYDVLEPVCAEYGSGADDDTAEAALELLRGLRLECGKRAERVKHYAKVGKAPENKVTPELASAPGSGLHPLVAFIDEAQELFAHEEFGKEAHRLAPQIVKLGRAYGVILLVGTQRPDKESLPPGLTANVNTRFCMAVMDQVANDMILGTSAYKNGHRANQFQPGKDAGWGIAMGLGKPAPVRSFYIDGPAAQRIVARAIRYRTEAGTMPDPEQPRERVKAYNLLDDVRAVWVDGEDALWSELIVPRLAQLRPDIYGGWDVAAFGAAMRSAGVPTTSIHRKVEGRGVTRYGVRLDALNARLTAKPSRQAIEDGDEA